MAKAPRDWVVISPELARTHPKFGLRKGGLFGITALMVYGLLQGVRLVLKDAGGDDGGGVDGSWMLQALSAAQYVLLAANVLYLLAWFSKWSGARVAFGVLTLAAVVPLLGLVGYVAWLVGQGLPVKTAAEALALPLLAAGFSLLVRGAVWQWMQRAPEFRVTFERRVRAGDPILARHDGAVRADI